ncbi:MAG: cytochrome c oxidase subunit 3 family protein [Burkholderiales bacterium]
MSAHVVTPFDSVERQSDAARLGMWIFLSTEILFFGPLFLGYVYGRLHFPDAFTAASRHTDVLLGTINTAVLLTSSFTMALAVESRRAGEVRLARMMLVLTAALGSVFLVIKGVEYAKDWHEHLVPGIRFTFDAQHVGGAELFFYLYFVMTGLHALHLMVGILIVLTMAALLMRDRVQAAASERVEIAGLYWHFVDVIWIFLYPILYLLGRAGS